MMNDLTYMLAQAVASPPDPQISGEWLLKLIPIVASAVVLILGRKHFKEQGRAEAQETAVTLRDPMPVMRTREEPAFVTRSELIDHIDRMDRQMVEVWEAIEGERKVSREALGKIHKRLDEQSVATAGLQGTVSEVAKNVGRVLDIIMNRKPTGTP